MFKNQSVYPWESPDDLLLPEDLVFFPEKIIRVALAFVLARNMQDYLRASMRRLPVRRFSLHTAMLMMLRTGLPFNSRIPVVGRIFSFCESRLSLFLVHYWLVDGGTCLVSRLRRFSVIRRVIFSLLSLFDRSRGGPAVHRCHPVLDRHHGVDAASVAVGHAVPRRQEDPLQQPGIAASRGEQRRVPPSRVVGSPREDEDLASPRPHGSVVHRDDACVRRDLYARVQGSREVHGPACGSLDPPLVRPVTRSPFSSRSVFVS